MKWLLAAAVALFGCGPANAADIRVLTTQGIEQAYRELVPQFEAKSGHTVSTLFTGTIDAAGRLAAGERFDLLIMPSSALAEHFAAERLVTESRTELATSGAGLGVKAGARKPDIGSTEALRTALLNAKSIGYSSGPTGVYFLSLVQRLAIADAVKDRMKQAPSGTFVGSMIASGEAEIGFQQIGELSHYPGVDFVGPLPAELQLITTFSSGILRNAKEPAAAGALVRFLKSSAANAAYAKRGMERIP